MSLWAVVSTSLLVWVFILPTTHSEQKLRWQSEASFPSHWDPPPRLDYGEKTPELVSVLTGLVANEASDWIVKQYAMKLKTELDGQRFFNSSLFGLSENQLADLLLELVERSESEVVVGCLREQLTEFNQIETNTFSKTTPTSS